MKIRAGIIGLGRIGSKWDAGKLIYSPRTHAGAILQRDAFDLCAVCDVDAVSRDAFVNDWNLDIPVYDSVAEMLSERALDLVSVAVPTSMHYATLKDIINSGKTRVIFCEKPFCENYGEASAICGLSEANNVVISVNYHRRWDDKIRQLKIQTDALGVPAHVSVLYGKGLLNYGSHIVDLLSYLFGPIKSVTNGSLSQRPSEMNDPSLSSVLNLNSGLQVAMTGLDDVNYDLFDIDIYYPEVKFHVGMGGYFIEMHEAVKDVHFKDYVSLNLRKDAFVSGPVHGLSGAYKEIEEYFVSGAPCDVSGAKSAIETMKVLDAIRCSASSKCVIAL